MSMQPEKLSFWLAEALEHDAPEPVSLQESISADVCIVGGGFTGLWSAIEIKRRDPATHVAIVERGLCGSGASGRNGGFVLSLWAKFLSLQKLCGTDEAVRLAKASAEAVQSIGDFCLANGIDADYRMSGWLWSASSAVQIGTWTETITAIESRGCRPFEHHDSDEIAAMSGSPRHLAGVVEPVAACVQPAKLALGLRKVALGMGVKIFEYTPMVQLKRDARPGVVCAQGTVTADRVIIALNAWGVMLKEIRKAIAVVSSDVVVTPPVPEALSRCGWRNSFAISDSRMLVQYYRTTRDDRIVFGKGGGTLAFGGAVGPAFDGPSPIAATVERHLHATYPDVAGISVDQSWTGPIDRSKHGLPIFGQLANSPQILYGVGYSGNGVGPSVLGGRILASLALGTKDEWSGAGLVKPLKRAFPPEPFRYAGGKVVRAAVASRDRADDAGRKAGVVVRTLASLAPSGLSPVRNDPPARVP
ncbi:MAG: FAD-binding oxidoreductase [Gammaproteobacteria bacterium]|nr:FAD-binding oxidoreductase [Gammaproteobacteria bacterium]